MRIELQQMLARHPNHGYIRYHLPRFERLFDAACRCSSAGTAILDIGKSPLTEVLVSKFGSVDTLGFNPDERSSTGNHYEFDLNDCRDKALYRTDLPKYDLVLFAEVVEHLHTSPNHVLSFLNSILKVDGILLLQTPNAVAVHKRVKMLFGSNPYELIRENPMNPGHHREYTRSELVSYLTSNGFTVESFSYENYFDYQYSGHTDEGELVVNRRRKLLNAVFSVLPPPFRPGMFFVAKKA